MSDEGDGVEPVAGVSDDAVFLVLPPFDEEGLDGAAPDENLQRGNRFVACGACGDDEFVESGVGEIGTKVERFFRVTQGNAFFVFAEANGAVAGALPFLLHVEGFRPCRLAVAKHCIGGALRLAEEILEGKEREGEVPPVVGETCRSLGISPEVDPALEIHTEEIAQ